VLSVIKTKKDMNLPGFDLHELKGNEKGTWSIPVNEN
jgi:plasmid maintenance system killer protein